MFNKYQQALNFFTRLPYRVPLKFANDEFCKKYDKNFALIKELVDKVTPKKPFYEADGYDENGELIYDTWICPNCNHYYEVDYDDYDYCPNCGQAIDRSDSDEKDNR